MKKWMLRSNHWNGVKKFANIVKTDSEREEHHAGLSNGLLQTRSARTTRQELKKATDDGSGGARGKPYGFNPRQLPLVGRSWAPRRRVTSVKMEPPIRIISSSTPQELWETTGPTDLGGPTRTGGIHHAHGINNRRVNVDWRQ